MSSPFRVKKAKRSSSPGSASSKYKKKNATTPNADLDSSEQTENSAFVFKDRLFVHSSRIGAVKKPRAWKNLKQIITAERSLKWPDEAVTYVNIEAPPSFKPAKRFSDLSGFSAKYRDPETQLYYTNAEEFASLRMLPSDIVAGHLALRRANLAVS